MLAYTKDVTPHAYFPDLDLVVAHYAYPEVSGEPKPHKVLLIPRPLLLEHADTPFTADKAREWTVYSYTNATGIGWEARMLQSELTAFLEGRFRTIGARPDKAFSQNDRLAVILDRNMNLDLQRKSLYAAEWAFHDFSIPQTFQETRYLVKEVSQDYALDIPKLSHPLLPVRLAFRYKAILGNPVLLFGTGAGSEILTFALTGNVPLYARMALAAVAGVAAMLPLALGVPAMKKHENELKTAAEYFRDDHSIEVYQHHIDECLALHEMGHAVDIGRHEYVDVRNAIPGHGPGFVRQLQKLITAYASYRLEKTIPAFLENCAAEDLTGERFRAQHPDMSVIEVPRRIPLSPISAPASPAL